MDKMPSTLPREQHQSTAALAATCASSRGACRSVGGPPNCRCGTRAEKGAGRAHEHKDDLDAIAACSRLKAWLRKDHIDRRYRGSDRYMRAATALREADPRVPPSLAELKKLFGLGKWAFEETDSALEDEARTTAIQAHAAAPSTEGLDYEALLEAAGCAVAGRSEVNAYMENHEIYDLLYFRLR